MHQRNDDKPGIFAQTVLEAMKLYGAQRVAGATPQELTRNLEQTLRASWPRRRDEPWHFNCEPCHDTGWRRHECPTTVCGRRVVHEPHSYVVPCLCVKGGRAQAALAGRMVSSGVDDEAGVAKPRRKPSRFGA